MHLGPEVRAMRLVLAELVHARERRDAERRDGRAKIQTRAHLDDGLVARASRRTGTRRSRAASRAARTCAACARPSVRLHDPELGEVGELLTLAADGVDGQAARRQTVARAGGERAEVARAKEHDELVFVLAGRSGGSGRASPRSRARPTSRGDSVFLPKSKSALSYGRCRALSSTTSFMRTRGFDCAAVEEHQVERQLPRLARSRDRGGSECRGTGRTRAARAPRLLRGRAPRTARVPCAARARRRRRNRKRARRVSPRAARGRAARGKRGVR